MIDEINVIEVIEVIDEDEMLVTNRYNILYFVRILRSDLQDYLIL